MKTYENGMNVIKIHKSYRNGIVTHYMVVYSDEKWYIEDRVIKWCADDPRGQEYGYGYDWEIVEDKEMIVKVIKDEILKYLDEIYSLNEKKSILEDYLSKNI